MLLLIALCSLSPLVSLSAQYVPGDILVTPPYNGRLYRLNASGTLQSASPSFGLFHAYSMMPAPDNRSVFLFGFGGPAALRVAPNGTVTSAFTQAPKSSCLGGADVDGCGTLYVADVTHRWLTVRRTVGTSWSTLVDTWPSHKPVYDILRGIKVRLDRDELTLMYSIRNSPQVFTASTRAVNQVQSCGWFVSHWTTGGWALGDCPDTGQHLVASRAGILRIDPGPGGVQSTLVADTSKLGYATGIVRDADSDTWVVATYDLSTGFKISRLDGSTGAVVGVLTSGPQPILVEGLLAVAGSRHVCGQGQPSPGRPYPFLVSFPGRPGAPYVAAASFGHRPAIRLAPQKRLHLAFDPLLVASLQGGPMFHGFRGRLDGNGEAQAALHVPLIAALSGHRFYVAAVTLGPGGFDRISDPVGVTIR